VTKLRLCSPVVELCRLTVCQVTTRTVLPRKLWLLPPNTLPLVWYDACCGCWLLHALFRRARAAQLVHVLVTLALLLWLPSVRDVACARCLDGRCFPVGNGGNAVVPQLKQSSVYSVLVGFVSVQCGRRSGGFDCAPL